MSLKGYKKRECNKYKHYTIGSVIKHYNDLIKQGKNKKEMAVYDCYICKAMHITRQTNLKQVIVKTLSMGEQVIVPAKTLTLAERKKNLEAEMQKKELELQGLLTNVADDKIISTLSLYKSKWKAMQDQRKEFTGYVSSVLIEPFMIIERRSEPEEYKPFKDLKQKELDIRVKKANEANSGAAIAKEKADYKRHVSDEFSRVYNERKVKMFTEISQAVKLGIPVSSPELLEVLTETASAPKVYHKMVTKHMQDADKLAIAKSITQPNYNALIEEMMALAISLEKDALEAKDIDQHVAELIDTANAEHEEDKEQNTLVAQAEASNVRVVGAKVVAVRKIVVENTKEWAEAIISAFYENDVAWLMLKNKTFEKVTIGHMAEALSKCSDITVEGVKYEEVKK